jgi:hypothetical protein
MPLIKGIISRTRSGHTHGLAYSTYKPKELVSRIDCYV